VTPILETRRVRKAFGGLGVILVTVGVELLGEAAVRLLDLGLGRAALQPQALVEVECHAAPMPQSFIADQMGCRAGGAKPKAPRRMTDPFALLDEWLEDARASELNDPNAMALATADSAGMPSVRMVLLKDHGPDGFVFYTNDESDKGAQLAANPKAALLLHWKSLRRQVRVEGAVERVSAAEADQYFSSRSRDSQLGAWASDQSRPLESRDFFETRYDEMKRRFEGRNVPRPSHWGGYRVIPERIEFWSDRPHRLHERRLFVREHSSWREGLLYP
jgi:pyridoxamine 5'-phosphate oxidase